MRTNSSFPSFAIWGGRRVRDVVDELEGGIDIDIGMDILCGMGWSTIITVWKLSFML